MLEKIKAWAANNPKLAWRIREGGLFGIEFKWYITGYGAEQGGIAYFTAYMIAMVVGAVINFFIQRSFVFRSKGTSCTRGCGICWPSA